MCKANAKSFAKDIIVRHYKLGDEDKLMKFLNFCYGNWGTLQKWHALYSQYPNFNKDDVFILEHNNEIIGHEGLHFRDLVIRQDCNLRTVSLSDAAVHPSYRARGLHNKLLEIMLQAAKSKGAGLVFSWYLKGTGLHAHSKKIGFVEVKQSPAYMRIIRPEKVLRSGLSDFLHKNQRLVKALQDLDNDSLYFYIGSYKFSITELLGKADKKSLKDRGKVEIILDESSLSTISKFRNMSGCQRLTHLALLTLSRKVKIKFNSFRVFLNVIWKGAVCLGSI